MKKFPRYPKGGFHPVDAHVGDRVKSRRKELGISQTALGRAVGLTFQQVQKYERGANRIGASRLYQFAGILDVPVVYFFEGLEGVDTTIAPDENDMMAEKGTRALVEAYATLPEHMRNQVRGLAKVLSDPKPRRRKKRKKKA